MATLVSILFALRDACRSRAVLQLEVLALRHQLHVLNRTARRPRLTPADRILWIWLARLWRGWRDAIVIVKPASVIDWHRRGCRLIWAGKSRRRGRPLIQPEVRTLIREMSQANPLRGAPRIH